MLSSVKLSPSLEKPLDNHTGGIMSLWNEVLQQSQVLESVCAGV